MVGGERCDPHRPPARAGGGHCSWWSCSGWAGVGWRLRSHPQIPLLILVTATVLPREPKRVTRAWVTLGPTAQGCPGDARRVGRGGWVERFPGEGSPESPAVLGQGAARMMTLQDSCQGWPSPGHQLPASPSPTQRAKTPERPRGVEEVDGWAMLEEKPLAWLNPCAPRPGSLAGKAPSPGQGWSSRLLSLRKRSGFPSSSRGRAQASPSRAPGAPARRAGALFVCVLGRRFAAVGRFLPVWAGCVGCPRREDYSLGGFIPPRGCVTPLFEQCPTVVPWETSTSHN